MPYLSFDLDALELAPEVAHHAGMEDGGDHVVHGLLKLWRYAWRQKCDVVAPGRLRGLFHRANPERIEAALLEYGFIAAVNNGTFRVRGAERYLRITEAQSKGGHASKGNLKRGKKRPEESRGAAGEGPRLQPESSRRAAGGQPESTPGSSPGLTASSEQRAANSRESSPLGDRLNETFKAVRGADYAPSFEDEQALRRVMQLAMGGDDEVVRRYGNGLRRARYPTVNTWADLAKHWNACAQEDTGPPGKPGRVNPAAPVQPTKDWSGQKTGTQDF